MCSSSSVWTGRTGRTGQAGCSRSWVVPCATTALSGVWKLVGQQGDPPVAGSSQAPAASPSNRSVPPPCCVASSWGSRQNASGRLPRDVPAGMWPCVVVSGKHTYWAAAWTGHVWFEGVYAYGLGSMLEMQHACAVCPHASHTAAVLGTLRWCAASSVTMGVDAVMASPVLCGAESVLFCAQVMSSVCATGCSCHHWLICCFSFSLLNSVCKDFVSQRTISCGCSGRWPS